MTCRIDAALGRRGLLLGGAAGLAMAAAAPSPPWETQERVRRWLAAWDELGQHRTATSGDSASADWLGREASAIGGTLADENFDAAELQARDAYVEIGVPGGNTLRILGEPLYDAPGSGPAGVEATFGPVGGGRIGLLQAGPLEAGSPGFIALRQRPDIVGLVVVTQGGAPGLALLDAPSFTRPFGPPVLQVTSFEQARLAPLAAAGVPARLVVDSRRSASAGHNIVVRVPGRAPQLPPLVVLTPRSAWWRAVAERGGGLVCWLEALRGLVATPPNRDVLLAAVSGHELGGLGLRHFLATRPGLLGRARFLVLGDNLGAQHGRMVVQGGSPARQHLGAAALGLKAMPGEPPTEAGVLHRAGADYLAVGGSGKLFHLPQDRWPAAVDVAAIIRLAAGVRRVVAHMSK